MAASYAHLVQALSDLLGADNVRAHERVARYTTWRVGGPAALLCVIHDTCALARTVALVRDTSLPWLVLGRGSNVLVDDAGVDGVVILNRAAGLAIDRGPREAAPAAGLPTRSKPPRCLSPTAAAPCARRSWCRRALARSCWTRASRSSGATPARSRGVWRRSVPGARRRSRAARTRARSSRTRPPTA